MFIKNAKGQIAIFFVLIFQVLFVLFAMTLNVTLVVHDKINMQNSLDLATYYGASKQAEVLNAMAHINYQMRQNYKLLAWRYRILGTVAIQKGGFNPNYWCPTNRRGLAKCSDKCPSQSPYPNDYCDNSYNVCVTADIWERGFNSTNTNICRNQNIDVRPIPNFPVIAGFLSFNLGQQASTIKSRQAIARSCKAEQFLNLIMADVFLSHFRLDQKDRKIMLRAIYEKTLGASGPEGPRDLNGDPIREGAQKVFEKNLNFANLKNFEKGKIIEFYSSSQDITFDEMFKSIKISPILNYLSLNDTCSGTARTLIRSNLPLSSTNPFNSFVQTNKKLFNLNRGIYTKEKNFLGTLVSGYKKDPSKIVYYGAKSSIAYNHLPQLFVPNPGEPITLKASSFAKPFGGRFGPDEKADKFIEAQVISGSSIKANFSYSMQPNYSRYPGDKWGLVDKRIHASNTAFLKKLGSSIQRVTTPYSIDLFDHLHLPDALSQKLDNNSKLFPKHFVRVMEMSAVFPDLFDIIHYSISHNYMENYFPKICNLIGEGGGVCKPGETKKITYPYSQSPGLIRGDFGYPANYSDFNKQSSKINSSAWPWFFLKNKNPVDLDIGKQFQVYSNKYIRYPYLLKDPAHLLTSWAPTINKNRYDLYAFPEKMFTKCYSSTSKTPHGCIQGGRNGYSVKMISCETIKKFSSKPNPLVDYCQ